MKLLPALEAFLHAERVFGVHDDFDHYVSADAFTTVASNSGTVAVANGAGGVVAIAASDATELDNDETYMKGTTEIFKFATGKPMRFAARVMPTATAIGTANFIIGIKDAVAADTLVDDGGGPPASYSGAVFFHVDGGTYWVCESSVGSDQTTVVTDKAVTKDEWVWLIIETRPISATETEVHFFIKPDGEAMREVGLTVAGNQIVPQTITHTSATEMQICLGAKDGADNNGAILYADRVDADQVR